MRPSATLVLSASGDWATTRVCLESVRATLRVRDQVVVVDDGADAGTTAGLQRCSWVRTVRVATTADDASRRAAGAAAGTCDVLVFLDDSALVPSRWLDALVLPLADPSVAATGPRTNVGSTQQVVADPGYDADRTADLQRFARAWRQEHRARTSEAEHLAGPCFAVRRDRFDALGDDAPADVDKLLARLRGAGGRLVVVHEAYIHSRSAPGALLSACMIMKDEEANLPSCLAALQGLVDEIVIYDTGSTDDSVRMAREAGATVLEGYWDDDFGRARNRALDACSGQWVLHVDADEIVECDSAEVRRELREDTLADAFSVAIGNVDDNGKVGLWHNAARLFRRGRARWEGRLHEQLASVDGSALRGRVSSLRLRHTGYTTEAITTGQKMERNLRVAELGLADRAGDAAAELNVGRSLSGVGRDADALAHFRRAVELTDSRDLRRQALRFGAEVLLGLGRPAETLEWVEDLREVCSAPTMPDYLEGMARYNLGDAAAAVECFARIDENAVLGDEDLSLPRHFVAMRKGMALLAGARWDEAADVLVAAAKDQLDRDIMWTPLLEGWIRSGRDLAELLALDRHPQSLHALGHAVNATPESAQAVALHVWASPGKRSAVVAVMPRLAPRLSLEEVLDWALRLRGEGLGEYCPLVPFASSERVPALDRLKAVAVLWTSLEDDRAAELLPAVLRDVDDDEIRAALLALDALSPALLPVVVEALAQGGRVGATARALDELGAGEQAEALRQLEAA